MGTAVLVSVAGQRGGRDYAGLRLAEGRRGTLSGRVRSGVASSGDAVDGRAVLPQCVVHRSPFSSPRGGSSSGGGRRCKRSVALVRRDRLAAATLSGRSAQP